MKKLLSIIIFCFLYHPSNAQILTGKELLVFLNLNLTETNEALRIKGYSYTGTDEKSLTYGFQPDNNGESSYWLFLYKDNGRISYTFNSDQQYENL